MGLAEVKARLAHISGIDGLKIDKTDRGTEIYILGDVKAEVPQGPDRKHMAYLEEKLNNPFEPTETPKMSITGLQSGAFQSKLEEIKKRIADKQTAGLAKIEGSIASGAAKLDQAVDGVTAKMDAEVDAQLAEFAQFTNGGPT